LTGAARGRYCALLHIECTGLCVSGVRLHGDGELREGEVDIAKLPESRTTEATEPGVKLLLS